MAFTEVHAMKLKLLIQLWQKGGSQRQIARSTGISRPTVRRYLRLARELGLSPSGPDPTEEQLAELAGRNRPGPNSSKTPARDVLEPVAERIGKWLTKDGLDLTRVHDLLGERGVKVSYSTLLRFARAKSFLSPPGVLTVRMADTAPGETIEVDFVEVGRTYDPELGKKCKTWLQLHVCSYSRHMFVWPTFSQKLPDVIEGLERAWEFFGGIPRKLVIDNFPASVAGPDRYNPRLTVGFCEYAIHRSFAPDPARTYRPKDKPKVENAAKYVVRRFYKGAEFVSLEDMRARARQWCLEVAGRRDHGTTRRRPLEVFEAEERHTLNPYDGIPYETPHWQIAKVQKDRHVRADSVLYSVPSDLNLQGKLVEVRLTRTLARIYYRSVLIKTHPRKDEGGRATDPDDVEPEKRDYAARDPEIVRRKAAAMGEAVAFYAEALLGRDPIMARLRSGHALIRLGERFGAGALERACRQAAAVELYDVGRLETMLLRALEKEAEPEPPPPPGRYARDGDEFTALPLIEDDRDHYERGA